MAHTPSDYTQDTRKRLVNKPSAGPCTADGTHQASASALGCSVCEIVGFSVLDTSLDLGLQLRLRFGQAAFLIVVDFTNGKHFFHAALTKDHLGCEVTHFLHIGLHIGALHTTPSCEPSKMDLARRAPAYA